MMTQYPPVGSRWMVTPCPDCERTPVEVISSGHGWVVAKAIDPQGGPGMAVDVLIWHRYYAPENIEK